MPNFLLLAVGTFHAASDEELGGPGNKDTITVPLAYWLAVVHNLLLPSIRYPADVLPTQPYLSCRTTKSQVCQCTPQMLVALPQEIVTQKFTVLLWQFWVPQGKSQQCQCISKLWPALWRNFPPKLRLTHAQLWFLKKRVYTHLCAYNSHTEKIETDSSTGVWIPILKGINYRNFISWDGVWVLQRRCCPLWPSYSAPLHAIK